LNDDNGSAPGLTVATIRSNLVGITFVWPGSGRHGKDAGRLAAIDVAGQ
jgi:hypothetical protein